MEETPRQVMIVFFIVLRVCGNAQHQVCQWQRQRADASRARLRSLFALVFSALAGSPTKAWVVGNGCLPIGIYNLSRFTRKAMLHSAFLAALHEGPDTLRHILR